MTQRSTGLLEEIRKIDPKKGPMCPIQSILEKLSKEDAKDLTEALNDHSIAGTTIRDVLRRRGHELGNDTVQRHRRMVCNCKRLAS